MKRLKRILQGMLLFPGLCIVLHLLFRSPAINPAITIAHRGASDVAPENTLGAIREAVNRGIQYVEIDIQQTGDNYLILMHDTTVDRTTDGTGRVRDLSLEDIQQLDAGSYFSGEFTGEAVPLFRDALELAIQHNITLIVEVKNPELYPQLANELISILDETSGYGNVIVISFDHTWLESLEQAAPDVETGSLWLWSTGTPRNHHIVSVHWSSVLIDPTQIYRQHRAGNAIWVWTVNHPLLTSLLERLGVDGIVTDTP